MFECKVGDLVEVKKGDYDSFLVDPWLGVCTWTDGYKYSFFVCDDGSEEVWHFSDLTVVGAEVIGK